MSAQLGTPPVDAHPQHGGPVADALSRSDRWRSFAQCAWLPAALAAAALLLAAGGATVNERAAEWLLRRDAEATAYNWATSIEQSLGSRLEALVARVAPSAPVRNLLEHARTMGNVFRFKLFDANGDLVFVSDDLDTAPGQLAESLTLHRGTSGVAAALINGGSHVEAARGTPPDRPAYYAEAYVPVQRDGQVVAIAEVYVDQTDRMVLYRQTFAVTGTITGLLVVVAALLPGYMAWRRSRERRRAEDQVRFLAHHDPLTLLPNRARFAEALGVELARGRRQGHDLAVLAIDLDNFKEVNDTLGHAAGDALLMEVARRLRAEVREQDVVARLGGDEFIIVQGTVQQPADAALLGERLIATLSAPYELPGGQRAATCGASVGVALAPVDGTDPAALLRAADAAMYRAKAEGRGRVRFFEEGMDRALAERRSLTQDLREALLQGTFTLAYQPLHDLPSGTLTSFEALLRWQHPTRGNVSPAAFIPLAEETGLIVPIGTWVLHQACRDAASWPENVRVAVNLSVKQFANGGAALLAEVTKALRAANLPPDRLELEVTESLLLQDTDAVLATLAALHEMGCTIALDDFGTGYSSLAYLWRFPFDKLKVDQSFVRSMSNEPKAAAIVATVVALGQALGLTTTAEGVETTQQLDALRAAGCNQGQGFLLGRPMPSSAAAGLAAAAASPRGAAPDPAVASLT